MDVSVEILNDLIRDRDIRIAELNRQIQAMYVKQGKLIDLFCKVPSTAMRFVLDDLQKIISEKNYNE